MTIKIKSTLLGTRYLEYDSPAKHMQDLDISGWAPHEIATHNAVSTLLNNDANGRPTSLHDAVHVLNLIATDSGLSNRMRKRARKTRCIIARHAVKREAQSERASAIIDTITTGAIDEVPPIPVTDGIFVLTAIANDPQRSTTDRQHASKILSDLITHVSDDAS